VCRVACWSTGTGATVRRLGAAGALQIDYVDGADHTFTTRGPRERMVDLLFAHIGALAG
jgi:hypothetical protein